MTPNPSSPVPVKATAVAGAENADLRTQLQSISERLTLVLDAVAILSAPDSVRGIAELGAYRQGHPMLANSLGARLRAYGDGREQELTPKAAPVEG